MRVLKKHPSTTAAEVAGHAATDIEQSISPALIRAELSNGGRQGRYVSDSPRADPRRSRPGHD